MPNARSDVPVLALAALLALAAFGGVAGGQALVPTGFSDELVADTLALPVGMAFLPDSRLLIVEQRTARIRMLAGGPGTPLIPVGTVPGVNPGAYERGLLGIAVDPGWPVRPYLYVHYTATGAPSRVRISRFRASGDLNGLVGGAVTIDPASRFDLVSDIPDSAPTHNGGTVRFGPDGMLYASLGEDATGCAAQDSTTLRGVILRLNVTGLPDGPGSATRAQITPADNPFLSSASPNARLVWALGLRNPFRFGIDPTNGALFVADVGQDAWEELDRIESGGIDFGWPYKEGPADLLSACSGLTRPSLRAPIFAYNRSEVGGGEAAVMGGVVYRSPPGAAIPFPADHHGDVFVSDFFAGHLWRLEGSGATWSVAPPVEGQPTATHWGEGFGTVSDYAVGPDGSLWYCRQARDLGLSPGTGQIRRVRAVAGPRPTPLPPAASFELAYPVPSTAAVRLAFTLTRPARVGLDIHDLGGRIVRRLVPPEDRGADAYEETWDGEDDAGRRVRPGLYFARLLVDGSSYLSRIVIAP